MMLLDRLAERLARSDMMQVAVLLFVALGFLLAVRWPTGISLVNESWFSLAPARTTLLAFAGLAYGAHLGSQPSPGSWQPGSAVREPATPWGSAAWRREALLTLLAILVLTAVSAPFEVASHAASYPGTPLWWTLLVPFLAAAGYFGFGLLFGRAAGVIRVRSLLPLLVPALLVGAVYLDVSLERTVVNPWSATLDYSPAWLVTLGLLTLSNLWWLRPRRPPPGNSGPAEGPPATRPGAAT